MARKEMIGSVRKIRKKRTKYIQINKKNRVISMSEESGNE